ncbi:MAG: response regulator [Candidatus Aminicenantes bacterium]|nr:MAG: response regulator [Candidatus Aminicenantes bacterium]
MAKKVILVADYDKRSLDSIAELLAPHNYKIISTMDGISAYEKFRTEMPDLVILEGMLPRLHGFDLTQKIYQETKGKTPVIIVTGVYKGPQYRNEAIRNLGASDYFEKPFDKSKLVKSVTGLLKDEVKIEEEEIIDIPDLPDTDSVMENLSQKLKRKASSAKKE